MAYRPSARGHYRRITLRLSLGVAVACLVAGCAGTAKRPLLAQSSPPPDQRQASTSATSANALHAATAYWAAAYRQQPNNPDAAINYALNLKALGSERKAYEVLAKAYAENPSHARLASEYGRLALQFDELPLAKRLLTQAEAGTRHPDWRLLSALGTLNAKLGDAKEAQRYFVAALQQKPDSTSIKNNLALAYALDGKADKAEDLLRQVAANGTKDERVRQNLALVLGLQGKFDEARQVAQADLPPEQAGANVAYLRNMIRQPTGTALARAETGADKRSSAIVTAAAAPLPTPAPKTGGIDKSAARTKASAQPGASDKPATVKSAAGDRANASQTSPTLRPSLPESPAQAWPDRLPWLTAAPAAETQSRDKAADTAAKAAPGKAPATVPTGAPEDEPLPWLQDAEAQVLKPASFTTTTQPVSLAAPRR